MEEKMQVQLNAWEEVVREYSMPFNMKKYEYVIATEELCKLLRT